MCAPRQPQVSQDQCSAAILIFTCYNLYQPGGSFHSDLLLKLTVVSNTSTYFKSRYIKCCPCKFKACFITRKPPTFSGYRLILAEHSSKKSASRNANSQLFFSPAIIKNHRVCLFRSNSILNAIYQFVDAISKCVLYFINVIVVSMVII